MLDATALYSLYKAMFKPYLNYFAELWGNTYKTNIDPLFVRQKKVIRIICYAKFVVHTCVFISLIVFKKRIDVICTIIFAMYRINKLKK